MITPRAGPHAAKCRLRLLIFVLLADAEQKEGSPRNGPESSEEVRSSDQDGVPRRPQTASTWAADTLLVGPAGRSAGSPVTDQQTGGGGWARSPETGPKVNLEPNSVYPQILRYYKILNSKQGRTNHRNTEANQRVGRPPRPLCASDKQARIATDTWKRAVFTAGGII